MTIKNLIFFLVFSLTCGFSSVQAGTQTLLYKCESAELMISLRQVDAGLRFEFSKKEDIDNIFSWRFVKEIKPYTFSNNFDLWVEINPQDMSGILKGKIQNKSFSSLPLQCEVF